MINRERQVQADLYCAFRNAIELAQETKGMRDVAEEKSVLDEINKVEVEVPVADSYKADVVIFRKGNPFLVIEVKKRAYTQPGRSLAAASKQVKKYARKLQSPFSAVCDGWIFILYRTYQDFWPINIYGFKAKENFAEMLLIGLVADDLGLLEKLPDVPDPCFVMKRIIPIIEKELKVKFPKRAR